MKPRVLFVCLGNAVRSQMAEGFAKTYGRDALVAASAGLTPAVNIDPATVRIMADIGVDVSEQFPKLYGPMIKLGFEMIVNMSGRVLPGSLPPGVPVVDWNVVDPVGQPDEEYRKVRDQIQRLTLPLIDEVRRQVAEMPKVVEPAPIVPDAPAQFALDRRRRLKRVK